ncbi:hypothetical protein RIF23_10255 [Lipingzhangella sp. LS1_29]|uniref:WD40 repeat protein n=1 Tax=Lipingzhangella rawalii TaxID=2055835 RepID=A0ABU2H789_9ACTN|nr:hypothetical protein [Lipingzhangella rawalii]MDS1270680.1 hypothetical protein [Lipingzhangella rawalii]
MLDTTKGDGRWCGIDRELGLEGIAHSPQHHLVARWDVGEALSRATGHDMLVRWDIDREHPTPVGTHRVTPPGAHGPFGAATATMTAGLVWLRPAPRQLDRRMWVLVSDWATPDRAVPLPEDLYDPRRVNHATVSPDGRLLALAGSETLRIIDTAAHTLVLSEETLDHIGEADDGVLGDWAVCPTFAPGRRRLAVGNTMQGSWWTFTVDLPPTGGIQLLWHREGSFTGPAHLDTGAGYPELAGMGPTLVTGTHYSPSGGLLVLRLRPDDRPHAPGSLAILDAEDGRLLRHQPFAAPLASRTAQAPLAFGIGRGELAVGFDDGVHILDLADANTHIGPLDKGPVHGLVADPHRGGYIIACDTGLVRLRP